MAARLKIFGVSLITFLFFTFSVTAASWAWAPLESHLLSNEKISSSVKSTFLNPSVEYINEGEKSFDVYCFQNVPKSIFQIWRSVQLVLLHAPTSYSVFHGANETEVYQNYESKSIWRPFFIFSSSDSIIEFPAFSQYCIGVATSEQYSFHIKVRTINYWKVLQTLLGAFLFLAAPGLSRNSFFHYASGVTLGILASFLILLYFVSRFIPQKSASYVVLVFGYSFVLYFLKLIWHHFHDIATQYMDIVLGYCVSAAFFSFVVCYRIGPVKSERTCNLIQWLTQALSLLLIFFSSEYREVSTAAILLLLSVWMIPFRWIRWVKVLWYRCFPPKVKFLTDIEYIEQGHMETKKALDSLKQYCSSPDCNVWKVVRNLKDPVRFANFIETGSHYTDEELFVYNSEDFDENIDISECA